jgi:flavin-dependent dehydrogenase
MRWLQPLWYERPADSVLDCDFAYSSAVRRPEEPGAVDGVGLLVTPDPGSDNPTRCGYLFRVEGSLALAGLAGRFGDFPTSDVDAWRAFGRSLSWPGWDELVRSVELVDGLSTFRHPRSVPRHVECLEWFPEGLVPIGDAVCSVNTHWGQGMTAAAYQVRALAEVLNRRCVGAIGLESLIDTDPDAAGHLADIFYLRRSLAALDEPAWMARLDAADRAELIQEGSPTARQSCHVRGST